MRAGVVSQRAARHRVLAAFLLPALVLATSAAAGEPTSGSALTVQRTAPQQPAPQQPAPQQPAPQQPATPQQPSFGAAITRVRVDAIVTDSDGRFVADLRPEDFRLSEDGEPQEILSLQLVDMSVGTVTNMPMGSATAEIDVRDPVGAASAEVSAAPDDLGALIFVIDGPSLDPRAKRRFADAWIELLDETESLEIPRAAFMIDAVGSLEALTPLTFDVEALQGAAQVVLETPTFGTSIHTRLRWLQRDMENDFDASNLVRAEEQNELVRSLNTFDLLTQFCDALASRPGRTAVIWVSTGVKLMQGGPFAVLESGSGPGGLVDQFEQNIPDRRIRAAQRDLHDAANSANVSIYTLDPSSRNDEDQFGFNVETATLADSNQLRSFDMRAALDGLRDSLRNAAEETGGQSFIYTADIVGALAKIREDSLRYYLLTYAAPRQEGDGEYHEIEVRVARDGVRVRARGGYVDWPAAERASRRLSAALAFPGMVSGLPIRAKALRRFGPDGEPIIQIVATTERPGADAVSGVPGGDSGLIDFYTVVLRGGDVVDEFRKTVGSLGGAAAVPASGPEQFIYVHDFDLDPGNYEVRLVAQGTADDELGATRLEFEVREESDGWQTSDLLLLGGDGGVHVRPLVADSISAGEVLTAYVEVAGGEQPFLSASVFEADGTTTLAQVPLAPMPADGSPIHRGFFRLRGLGVGSYVVQVVVLDASLGESASFRVPIEVTDDNILRVAAENLFGAGASRPRIAPSSDVARLLGRLARLSSLYQGDTLRFTARETIVETRHSYSPETEQAGVAAILQRISEFDYVHGQRDPLTNGEVSDFRRRVGSPAASAAEELDGFELTEMLDTAHSWPLLFSAQSGQSAYQYEIAGRDSALGRPALLVAFRPATDTSSRARAWFGTAWIDIETFQILRVHALERADFEEKVRFVGALASMEASGDEFVFTEITTDYWEEINGLRFPGQVTIVRNRYRITGNAIRPYETLPQVEVSQTYIDYDFLTIPTAEAIRRLILGY